MNEGTLRKGDIPPNFREQCTGRNLSNQKQRQGKSQEREHRIKAISMQSSDPSPKFSFLTRPPLQPPDMCTKETEPRMNGAPF